MVPDLEKAIQIRGKLQMGFFYSWGDQEGKEECGLGPEEVDSWDRNLLHKEITQREMEKRDTSESGGKKS